MAKNPKRLERKAFTHSWSIVGTVLGAAGYIASLTPTLLPRTTLSQVAASVLVVVTMYAIGASIEGIVAWALRKVRTDAKPKPRHLSRPLIIATVILFVVAAAFTPSRMQWQAEQAQSVGVLGNPTWPLVVILTFILFVVCLYIGRGVRALARKIGQGIGRLFGWGEIKHAAASGWIGGVATAVTFAIVAIVLFQASMIVFNNVNNSTVAGNTQPQSPTRSGSPQSLISWDSLGQQGRLFVDQGPQPAAITQVTNKRAQEPIRIFAGLESADGLQAQADLALADLKRAGGLERSHVIVYTPSDNGTVDPNAAAAAEYVTGGDVASVAMQYTVLPSFLSYALSQSTSLEAGTILFDTIHQAIQELPAGKRPKLYVYGESLGAFGSQAPFAGEGIEAIVDKTDGALWAGPPSTSQLWDELNREASGGTPWQPVVGGGTVVRFAADQAVIAEAATDTEWGPKRALYLQNSTDPVVWWPGSVLTERPAWLDEPRGPGVPAQMTWLPLITFEQMLLDMPFAVSMPPGVGHNYFQAVGPAWVQVLMPSDWTPAQTKDLQQALNS
ncbi:MAG: alpha/beta-hydrolase family protein [Candidatus Nanopelagicales bacterium]